MFSHLKKSLSAFLVAATAAAFVLVGCSSPVSAPASVINALDREITISVGANPNPAVIQLIPVRAVNASGQSYDPVRYDVDGNAVFRGLVAGEYTFTAEGLDADGNAFFRGQITLNNPSQSKGSILLKEFRVQPVFVDNANTVFAPGDYLFLGSGSTGTTIYYTTDGTEPTPGSSPMYDGGLQLQAGMTTVKAIGVKASRLASPVMSKAISFDNTTAAQPTMIPEAGIFQTGTTVNVQLSAPGATIYWTNNPNATRQNFQLYSGSIPVTSTTTIRTYAVKSGLTDSAEKQATYAFSSSPVPTQDVKFSLVSGSTYNDTQTLSLSSEAGAVITYTLDGGAQQTYNDTNKITLTKTASKKTYTVVAWANLTGKTNSSQTTATYTIDPTLANQTAAPVITVNPTNGQGPTVTFSIVAATSASIYFNLTSNGTIPADPTTASTLYTGSIVLSTVGQYTIKAVAIKTGETLSNVTSATGTVISNTKSADPVFDQAGGNYTADVSINLSSLVSGTPIYYSVDGSTPTEDQAHLYTGTIKAVGSTPGVTKTTVVKAFAHEPGKDISNLVSRTYNVTYPLQSSASATPGTSSFDSPSLTVTLNASNPANGTYTLNGGAATAYTNGQTISLSATTTLVVTNGTASNTYTYTKIAPPPAPVITMTPAAEFDTSLNVVITISNNPTSASYTVNGGTAVAISGGSATVPVSVTSTIAVTASNAGGNDSKSTTYTKKAAAPSFSWDNATVYFVITDRFYNGNSSNDNSYGRVKVDATGKRIGTFHGGDLAGLTAKLNANYFSDLGVNAIWISAPYEQVHGWAAGGSGDFAHYAYHGYYAQDFSNIDANMGTKEEFKTFVETAHSKGIRVVMDVVMNHTGYNTLKDMDEFNFGGKMPSFSVNWAPDLSKSQNWSSFHNICVDYNDSTAWGRWWGGAWVRAGLGGYPNDIQTADQNKLLGNLSYLPDFRTENTTAVALPTFLKNKTTYGGAFTNYNADKNKTQRVRNWIAEWLTQWVREYGIDGFRSDTAQHVELDSWSYLKTAATTALQDWRAANPDAPGANWTDGFWTTAEVFGAGMNGYNNDYHGTGKFDSLINFGYMGIPRSGNIASAISTWASYAGSINATKTDRWNYLSFMNNHDKGTIWTGSEAAQRLAGSLLLLAPGAVQIYYGDEYGRVNGENGTDPDQGSRSDFIWTSTRLSTVTPHWQKVGQFRNKHVAIGGGDQANISTTSGQAISRVWGSDKVAIVLGASGNATVTVSSLFADGTPVRNFYDGATATVTGGTVTFSAGTNGLILIEAQ